MEEKACTISLPKNPEIIMKVIPGHFTTNNSHVSHYLDVSELKSNVNLSREVARELAYPYLTNVLVDTIVCMEGTEVIGAFMAEELLQDGNSIINSESIIHVVTPSTNINGQLIFLNNVSELIWRHNVVLLVASASSGKTIASAKECITYYGGDLVGISALFSAVSNNLEQKINTLFTGEDIEDYQIYNPGECKLCHEGHKLEAIINKEGYTKL